MTLQDTRIVIVGGTSGIGLAVAQAALDGGASVVVASNNQDHVDRARAELASRSSPSRSVAEVVDVGDEDAIKRFAEGLGAFDHLVYTAGENVPLGPLVNVDLHHARDRFNVRYWGALAAVKYGAPSIRAGGSIVLTSGFSAVRPKVGWTSQAGIQSAVEGVTRALALELAPIRVNAVSPGLSATPRWDALSADVREKLYDLEEQRVPLKRLGTASEVATAYIYLMQNTYATGTVVRVDGGAEIA